MKLISRGILLSTLLLVGVCAAVTAAPPPDKATPPLAPDEFGLNFHTGKKAKANYKSVLLGDLNLSSLQYRPELDDDDTPGVTVKGNGDGAFGVLQVQRDMGVDWSAQVRVQTSRGNTGAVAGIERDVRNNAGELTDFLFVGVTPNPGINGVTAFSSWNGNPFGTNVNLPNTTIVCVAIVQDSQNAWAVVRPDSSPNFILIGQATMPQPALSHIGFGASSLTRGASIGFSDYLAKGDVKGFVEAPLIDGANAAQDALSGAEDKLRTPVDKTDALSRLDVVQIFLEELRDDIDDALNDGQASTQMFSALGNAKLALKQLAKQRRLITKGKSERALTDKASPREAISNLISNLRGIVAKTEADAVLERRPINISFNF